jgi:hypothetical protein
LKSKKILKFSNFIKNKARYLRQHALDFER